MKNQPDPLGTVVTDFIDVLEGKKPAAEATIGGDQELTNEQRARLPYVMAQQRGCVLCGKSDVHAVNYWVVPDALAQGRKDAKIFFSLCLPCFRLPDRNELVAGELISRVEGQTN